MRPVMMASQPALAIPRFCNGLGPKSYRTLAVHANQVHGAAHGIPRINPARRPFFMRRIINGMKWGVTIAAGLFFLLAFAQPARAQFTPECPLPNALGPLCLD